MHSTHLLALVSQAGLAEGVQSVSPAHCTHAPVVDLHTGRARFLVEQPSTGASCVPQPTQVCELPQMGLLGSLQSVLLRRPTHWLGVRLQKAGATPPSAPPSAPPSTPPSALPAQSPFARHPTHLPLVP